MHHLHSLAPASMLLVFISFLHLVSIYISVAGRFSSVIHLLFIKSPFRGFYFFVYSRIIYINGCVSFERFFVIKPWKEFCVASPSSVSLLRPFHSAAKSGKAVFVNRRQQVDMPNQPTITIFLVNTFKAIVKVGCLAGYYRRFVILLAVPPLSSRQLLCPSASFTQPLLIRSIPPCSQQCCCFSAWHPAAKHKPKPSRMHSHFHKPLHGSLGSIPLLPRYFISAGFSPPAANFYFARRSPHLGFVHLAAAIAHSPLISQSIAKVHLHSSATYVPCGKYTPVASYGAAIAFVPHALLPAPLWGLAVRLHDVVPPYSGGRLRLAIPTVRTSVPHGHASFSPQALLPEIQRKICVCISENDF
jgi:hypothetical protein